nr:hypothetical protein [Hungatella effluvii]
MVNPEKGMGGTTDDHPDSQYNNWCRRRGTERRTLFYKQPAIRDRRNNQGSPWPLDGGELSLAPGCDIPGGWEPYVRKTSGLSFEYHKEAGPEYVKSDRSGKSIINMKKKL